MKKYVIVKTGSIIQQIARPTDVTGYTEGIIECFLPDIELMTDKECDQWIKENNKRMSAICKYLNDNNL